MFSAEGMLGCDRPCHLAKGHHSADLNGRLIQLSNPSSALLELRFQSKEEAAEYFGYMRALVHGHELGTRYGALMSFPCIDHRRQEPSPSVYSSIDGKQRCYSLSKTLVHYSSSVWSVSGPFSLMIDSLYGAD